MKALTAAGIASVVGLIVGLVLLTEGVFYICGSMEPQAANVCSGSYNESLVAAGISIIVISLVVLAFVLTYSFLESRRGLERREDPKSSVRKGDP